MSLLKGLVLHRLPSTPDPRPPALRREDAALRAARDKVAMAQHGLAAAARQRHGVQDHEAGRHAERAAEHAKEQAKLAPQPKGN